MDQPIGDGGAFADARRRDRQIDIRAMDAWLQSEGMRLFRQRGDMLEAQNRALGEGLRKAWSEIVAWRTEALLKQLLDRVVSTPRRSVPEPKVRICLPDSRYRSPYEKPRQCPSRWHAGVLSGPGFIPDRRRCCRFVHYDHGPMTGINDCVFQLADGRYLAPNYPDRPREMIETVDGKFVLPLREWPK